MTACQAATVEHARAPTPGQVVLHESAGMKVATLVRGSRGVSRVALYLDAGSRDAAPAQLATVAAWLAAARGGLGVEALVSPDTTELARDCRSAALSACLAELRSALDARAPTAVELASLLSRLREGRRRVLAADPERQADRAALTALLGDAAGGFFPLGDAAADDAVDAPQVDAFLRAHYGPMRALLVVAGDADPERVRDDVKRAFAGAKGAERARAVRRLEPADAPHVLAQVDDRDAVTLAIAAADTSRARDFSEALTEALPTRVGESIELRGETFAVRGGALSLLRARGASAEPMLQTLAREAARLLVETPPPAPAARHADDLAGVARAFAERWSSLSPQAQKDAVPGLAFAVGVLVKGARGDGLRSKELMAGESARVNERLQKTLAASLATVRPVLRGKVDAHAASVATSNGARIEVRVQRGERVAIAVRSALGAGEDPALVHGRTALLATLTTTACAGMGPERLRAELTALGATFVPRVDAESYGLVLTVPREALLPGLALALRCMREPSDDPAHFADAALRLQARLGGPESALALRAHVAHVLAPRAPGLCAPWGHPGMLGNASAREVLGILPRAATGARSSVAIVGDVIAKDATAAAARRVALLPAGALPAPLDPGSSALPPKAANSSGTEARVLAIWQAPRSSDAVENDAIAARVAALSLRTRLAHSAGMRVLSHDAGACVGKTWAMLELRVAPEALADLAGTLKRTATELDRRTLAEALAHAQSSSRDQRAALRSRLDVTADELARARLRARTNANDERSEDLARVSAILADAPLVVSLD